AQPRRLPGARRASFHAPRDGGSLRARVPAGAGKRHDAAGPADPVRDLSAVHIALASHYRLPVAGYGGTERVVVALARGLASLGHRVTLLALPGTRVPEAAVVEVPEGTLTDPALDLSTLAPRDADILHAHFPVARAPSRPFVQTLHGHLRPGMRPALNTIFVSRRHAALYGSDAFVHNGLDPADYSFRTAKGDYDLFLGRLHRAKGYRWAIAGARRAGRRLVLAGGWRPSLRRGIRFAGVV